MKINFEKLEHQQLAINKVISLFKDNQNGFKNNNIIFSNHLTLSKEKVLNNYKELMELDDNSDIHPELDFTIEMETGTGKTLTYIETGLKLNKEYGLTKFIILVPSIAIREGVLKTFEITKEYLKKEFNNIPYNYFLYDSKNLSLVKEFIQSNQLQFMIMTIDSFNKDSNILNKYSDSFGSIPIDSLKQIKPILIIDEPQNFEGNSSKEAIKNIDYLFTLRYSATHKNNYNMLYKLDSFDAYRLGLVKEIEVLSVVEKNNSNNSIYLSFNEIKSSKKSIKAQINIFDKNNKLKKLFVEIDDDLSIYNELYKGYKIKSISNQEIEFYNDKTIEIGKKIGHENTINKDTIMKSQIIETIKEHINKEKTYLVKGIKVLSLFFIDKVDNYQKENGKIKQYFNECIQELLKDSKYKEHIETYYKDLNKIHNGYFSKKDTTGKTLEDKDTYNLIMKDKEKLLSIDEPLRFIFSHSALREGWDNPNVFQICTLNETLSEMKKRQEIGRGLRICVDKEGNRIYDEYDSDNNKITSYNTLTIIANENYEEFTKKLQKEMEEESGKKISDVKSIIKNKNNSKKIIRNGNIDNKFFKELWGKISYKSYYEINNNDNFNVETENLVSKIIAELNKENHIKIIKDIKNNKISITKTKTLKFENNQLKDIELVKTASGIELKKIIKNSINFYNVINTISLNTGFKNDDIKNILFSLNQEYKEYLFINENDFINKISNQINTCLEDLFINENDFIKFNKSNEEFSIDIFEKEFNTYVDSIYKTEDFFEKVLYDNIIFDSKIEESFIKELSINENVKFFIKLPNKFKINTLLNEKYNPDWAIVSNDNKIDIIETKSIDKNTGKPILDDKEKIKTLCGKLHFNLENIDYKIGESFK